MVSCCSCGQRKCPAETPTVATVFFSFNCGHLCCPACIVECIPVVGNSSCPDCKEDITTINTHSYVQRSTRSSKSLAVTIKTSLRQPTQDCLVLHQRESKPKVLLLQEGAAQESTVAAIFKSLQPILNPHVNRGKGSSAKDLDRIEGETIMEKVASLARKDEETLLHIAIRSLALGEQKLQKNRADKVSTQILAATENIRFLFYTQGSLLRRLTSKASTLLGYNELNRVFKTLGYVYGRQTERKVAIKRAKEKWLQRNNWIKINPNSYAILLFDNLGFKNRQGFRRGMGYEQFTVLKTVLIPHESLEKAKILELDRNKKTWVEIRNDTLYSYEKTLEPNHDDLELLAEVHLSIIEDIMKGENNGVFPSLSMARKLLVKNVFRKGQKPRIWESNAYYGRTVVDDENDNNDSFENIIYDMPMYLDLNKKSTVIEILDYAIKIRKKILESNDDGIGVLEDIRIAIAGDGSPIIAAHNIQRKNEQYKNEVLAVFGGFHLMLETYKKRGSLFEHTHLRNMFSMWRESMKAQDFVLQPSDPNQAEAEGIKMHAGLFLGAIRALLYLKVHGIEWDAAFDEDFELYDMSDDDEEEDDESYGSNDDDSTSDSSEDEYSYASEDITEAEEDDSSAASDDTIDLADENEQDTNWESYKRYRNMQDPMEQVKLNPAEVVDFCLSRMKRNPQLFIMILDLRFQEVIFMLLRAEGQRRVDLYIAAMKIAMTLFVNTNATNYVEMVCNFVIDRSCMSEAERMIHDEFILFRRTRNGKSIFCDRCVEWTMRDIRRELGKFFNSSTYSQLIDILLEMNDNKTSQGRNRKDSSSTVSRKTRIEIDACFLESYVFSVDSNLWIGTPKEVPAKPFYKRVDKEGKMRELKNLGPPKKIYSTDDKEELLNDVLASISTGRNRGKEYYSKYHMNGDVNCTTRSQKDCNLKKVSVNTDRIKEEIALSVCLNEEVLVKSKLYTVARIRQELSLLEEELQENDLPIVRPEGNKKLYLVQALIKGRKILKAEAKWDWEETTKAKIESRLENINKSAIDIITEELKDKFFHLSGANKDLARQKLYTFSRSHCENQQTNFGHEIDDEIRGLNEECLAALDTLGDNIISI